MEEKPFTLFITTPFGSPHTLRNLTSSDTTETLLRKLELITGFPSGTYNIHFGNVTLSEGNQPLIGSDLKCNSMLRMTPKDHLVDVISCLKSKELRKVVEVLSHQEDAARTSVLFIAACICANLGWENFVSEFIKLDPLILSAQTVHGRILVHIATVGDQSKTLYEILLAAAKYNVNITVEDKFKRTPSDLARQYKAIICERMLREFAFKRRSNSLHITENLGETSAHTINTQDLSFKKKRTKSAKSTQSVDSFGKSLSRLSGRASSGYYTQENVSSYASPEPIPQSRLESATQHSIGSEKVKRSTSPKRVTFEKRTKSAPVVKQTVKEENVVHHKHDRENHTKCFSGKPFMAYRSVPEEELRPLAVEFVPMPSTNIIGLDQKAREKQVQDLLLERSNTPFSSLSGSVQDLTDLESFDDMSSIKSELQFSDRVSMTPEGKNTFRQTRVPTVSREKENNMRLQEKQELQIRYTNPPTTSKRAQSAKYYKATYHKRVELEAYHEVIPPPRPKTANSRYRSWKPWLLEKYAKEMAKTKAENEPDRIQNRRQSAVAFHKWLKQKHSEHKTEAESEESSEEDESSSIKYNSEWAQKYYAAFDNDESLTFDRWLQNKAKMFKDMDEKTLLHRRGESNAVPKNRLDRRVTIYEIGCTSDQPMKIDDPNSYMRAFQKWKQRKAKYEYWKKKQGVEPEDPSSYSTQKLNDMRSALYLDGFAYNEWLGQIDREEKHVKSSQKRVHFNKA